MNGQYLKNLPIEKIMNYAQPFFEKIDLDTSDTRKLKAVVENARKRVNTIPEMIDYSTPFFLTLFHISTPIFLTLSIEIERTRNLTE